MTVQINQNFAVMDKNHQDGCDHAKCKKKKKKKILLVHFVGYYSHSLGRYNSNLLEVYNCHIFVGYNHHIP